MGAFSVKKQFLVCFLCLFVVISQPTQYFLQIIGPIVVDTTPPVFTGTTTTITVTVEDDNLIAQWSEGDFVDDMDPNLSYYIAAGKEKTVSILYT